LFQKHLFLEHSSRADSDAENQPFTDAGGERFFEHENATVIGCSRRAKSRASEGGRENKIARVRGGGLIEARDQALREGWETAAKRFLFSIGSKYQEIPDAVNNKRQVG
jgi:hypothetical protein